MPRVICNICGYPLEASDLPAIDEDGAPCHEACLEDLQEQDRQANELP